MAERASLLQSHRRAKSLSGKVAIVTGSNCGIGKETAKELAARGASVILACRSLERAQEAAADILQACPDAKVEPMLLNLGSLDSVRSFASNFKARGQPLHILVNNAGANFQGAKPKFTPDGIGLCAQINFLGPYALTRLLEEPLTAGVPSKVVNVSSIMHRYARIKDAASFLHDWKSGGYSPCKLANVLFTNELQRRWAGKGVEASAVDPGSVYSSIWRGSIYSRPPLSWVLENLYAPPSDGATTTIHAATASSQKSTRPGAEADSKFYARGVFASSVVVSPSGVLRTLLSPLTVVLSLCDWPIRRLSGGRLLSEVKEVPSSRSSYNRKLAADLWETAAVAAGLGGSNGLRAQALR